MKLCWKSIRYLLVRVGEEIVEISNQGGVEGFPWISLCSFMTLSSSLRSELADWWPSLDREIIAITSFLAFIWMKNKASNIQVSWTTKYINHESRWSLYIELPLVAWVAAFILRPRPPFFSVSAVWVSPSIPF